MTSRRVPLGATASGTRLYRDYVLAIVDVVRPTHIGLAAETNLIRAAAPRAVYDAVVTIPTDYYSRIAATRSLPLMVVEGGWSSGSLGTFQSSPQLRARYIHRQSELLDAANAVAVFSTDLHRHRRQQHPAAIRLDSSLFAALGMVDTQLRPKPALAVWDSLYARRRQ